MNNDKTCFFISGIGQVNSETRIQSDYIMGLLKDTLDDLGYNVIRADTVTSPGSITHRIIDDLFESELVVADLSGKNQNVYYELAVRHATNKPYIQIIESEQIQHIPFDLHHHRTLPYSFDTTGKNDDGKNEGFKKQIRDFLVSSEYSSHKIKNPIAEISPNIKFLNKDIHTEEELIFDIIHVLSSKTRHNIATSSELFEQTISSTIPYHNASVEIYKSIRRTLQLLTWAEVMCSGPLIMKIFNTFIKYAQHRFVAVSVDDTSFWIKREGKDYLAIIKEQYDRNKRMGINMTLERIFVINTEYEKNGHSWCPTETEEKKIFLHQIKNGYSIGFVEAEELKGIDTNVHKLDFGLFDNFAVSFFRVDKGREFHINTNKDFYNQYSEYYKEIKRKCLWVDEVPEKNVTSTNMLSSQQQYFALKAQKGWR